MLIVGSDRAANVRTIAARIAKQGEGLSIREFLDGSALAAGAIIKSTYRGEGVEVAINRYCEAMLRAVTKEAS